MRKAERTKRDAMNRTCRNVTHERLRTLPAIFRRLLLPPGVEISLDLSVEQSSYISANSTRDQTDSRAKTARESAWIGRWIFSTTPRSSKWNGENYHYPLISTGAFSLWKITRDPSREPRRGSAGSAIVPVLQNPRERGCNNCASPVGTHRECLYQFIVYRYTPSSIIDII